MKYLTGAILTFAFLALLGKVRAAEREADILRQILDDDYDEPMATIPPNAQVWQRVEKWHNC